jgi:hypothetical protein
MVKTRKDRERDRLGFIEVQGSELLVRSDRRPTGLRIR